MTATRTFTRRHSAGNYTVHALRRRVTITYFAHLRGWIAAAEWDRHLYTDPLPTKRDAMREAQAMITEED